MKRALAYLCVELVFSFIIAIGMNEGHFTYDLMTMFGLANAIVALFVLLLGLGFAIAKHKDTRSVFISAGLLLLIGVATCSGFPMRLNMH